jgi:hypothetical protein
MHAWVALRLEHPPENKDIAMKLQDKLEALATTASERRVIRMWLREGRGRSKFVRALGESTCSSNRDASSNSRLGDGLPDGA